MILAPFARQFPLFHFLLFPVSTGTATTASVHDVLQPHHFAAPVVASQWLPCSAMAAKPGIQIPASDYSRSSLEKNRTKISSLITG
ncbi:hypothetical protein OIU76_018570 [Salix suchowensis]|nr:hypothetical protein OIU76_018570 [Salix suchowensis]